MYADVFLRIAMYCGVYFGCWCIIRPLCTLMFTSCRWRKSNITSAAKNVGEWSDNVSMIVFILTSVIVSIMILYCRFFAGVQVPRGDSVLDLQNTGQEHALILESDS